MIPVSKPLISTTDLIFATFLRGELCACVCVRVPFFFFFFFFLSVVRMGAGEGEENVPCTNYGIQIKLLLYNTQSSRVHMLFVVFPPPFSHHFEPNATRYVHLYPFAMLRVGETFVSLNPPPPGGLLPLHNLLALVVSIYVVKKSSRS